MACKQTDKASLRRSARERAERIRTSRLRAGELANRPSTLLARYEGGAVRRLTCAEADLYVAKGALAMRPSPDAVFHSDFAHQDDLAAAQAAAVRP